MSGLQPEEEELCTACAVRRTIVDACSGIEGSGELGKWVDGIVDAAAQIAAFAVVEGKESDERALLIDRIGRRFDHFVGVAAQLDAEEATKQ